MYSKWERFAALPKWTHLLMGAALVLAPRLVAEYSTWTIAGLLIILGFALYARQLARFLLNRGITPNQVTIVGFLFSVAAFWPFVAGRLELAFVLITASVAIDVQDGFMARLSGLASQRGGFLDSTLDRVADGIMFGGLSLYFATRGDILWAGLSLAALLGAVMVSYTRAKAERYLDICEVGFLGERPDRNFTIIPFGITGYVEIGIAIVILTTWLTTIRRMVYAWKHLSGSDAEQTWISRQEKTG